MKLDVETKSLQLLEAAHFHHRYTFSALVQASSW